MRTSLSEGRGKTVNPLPRFRIGHNSKVDRALEGILINLDAADVLHVKIYSGIDLRKFLIATEIS